MLARSPARSPCWRPITQRASASAPQLGRWPRSTPGSGAGSASSTPSGSSPKHLRPYVKQQWPPLLVAAIATLVIAAADVASPLPLAYLIDHVLTVGGKGTEVDLS